MRRRAAFALLTAVAMALESQVARGTPSVWVIDDGEKIRRDATATPFEQGDENPVWRPNASVRTFAMQNESIALQVVVEADETPLEAVQVDLAELQNSTGARLVNPEPSDAGATGALVARPIERFVEHFVVVSRASGGHAAGESLGWESGAAPLPVDAWVGPVPDALVPVEIAAPWASYPMRIEPSSNGIVWIDINVPTDQPAGVYLGPIVVRDRARELARIPLELEVIDRRLPDRAAGAIVYYDPQEVVRRVGPRAEEHLWKILHAHRIAPLHDVTKPDDVRRQREALDGSLYARDRGYLGPAPNEGDGVLSLGAYGALGDANARTIGGPVKAIADLVAHDGLFDSSTVFLYADDERCSSPRGAAWRTLLRSSVDPNLRRIRVAWTCSQDPAAQPVDIAMLEAAYDVARVRAAREKGIEVWVYNGVLPRTGTFLLDADAVSPRVNGWISAMFDVAQWFYWESTYWYDRHGKLPVDPFATAESLHNDDGDWANGDGVLLYPGRQVDAFTEHSLGFDGVIPSVRLKNWRRGLEDAGYIELARARDRMRADAVTRTLIPVAFDAATSGRPASWSSRGKSFFDARRALLAIALGDARPSHEGVAAGAVDAHPRRRASRAVRYCGGALAAALAAGAVAVRNWRRRQRARKGRQEP